MDQLDQMRKGTTTLAILKLLAESPAPMHGYQIAKALEARSQGQFHFKEGLVYPRLHQMEREGLVSSVWTDVPEGRRRKVYTPTEGGRRRLAEGLEDWRTFRLSMEGLLG